MNKRQYCESRESIAYYSGLNGLEIKGIEYGINDLDRGDYTGYSTQYIDLWVTILTVVDTVF